MIRVTVWNEYCHEQEEERIRKVYPNGIHSTIAEFLGTNEDIQVTTATLYDENMQLRENAGITDELLANTDVMFWWGHVRHGEVPDEIAVKVKEAVNEPLKNRTKSSFVGDDDVDESLIKMAGLTD